MAQLEIAYLLRPGTQEYWRRLCQEVAGSRRVQFEASCQEVGITQVRGRLVQMLRGELLLVTVHMREPHQALQEFASSQRPFDGWLRAQLHVFPGSNIQDALLDPHGALIFACPGEQSQNQGKSYSIRDPTLPP